MDTIQEVVTTFTSSMAKGSKYGKMELCTKETGEMAKLRVRASFTTLMETSIPETLKRIELLASVSIGTLMGRNMLDSGKMTCNMEQVLRPLRMVLNLMVSS